MSDVDESDVIVHPWKVAASQTHDEVQLASWREALEAQHGNISRAADVIGVSRSHAMRLMKKYALTEFAAKLREEFGSARVRSGERKGVVLGRPRK